MAQGSFKVGSHAAEGIQLRMRKFVVGGLVGGCQVRHQAGDGEARGVLLQLAGQLGQVGFVEAEAAHAGIEFEVDRG